ncbi:hypothetical protein SAMN05216188_11860 [Lentzea xinjiangensis]|uniref:Uncharacterized protein n=1 Tax=Lentzea xinjiangensis TaxID=402600 RepID=A0A1H9TDX6_9PSEU|nr:hypothetical protein [Lentzea xinjiangensis]SER95361.1 hypothetical protein SAMN05216188_11860 [Lentzea xinjiangensis]
MARTLIGKLTTTRAGAEPAMTNVDATASPDGMYFPWTPTARLLVKTGGTATNVTIDVATQVDGLDVTDRVVAVAATTPVGEFIGPFGPEYKHADGNVRVNFSSATNATCCIID